MEGALGTDSDEATTHTNRAHVIRLLVTVAWGLVVCTGFLALWGYAHTPGANSVSPTRWPQDSQIQPSGAYPSLLLFAHPKCPCTRASIRELERLTARLQGKVKTCVVFIKPSQCDEAWWRTDLQRNATAIPGVHVLCDEGGVETERFRARTSGLALLYARTGKLLFEGGITSSRGHDGDNNGITAIEALVLNGNSPVTQTPVFGCPLHSPDSLAAQEQQ